MPLPTGKAVPAELAEAEVLDRAGEPSRLGTRWEGRPVVLVFLRHFACVACSEYVTMLMPRTHELHELGLKVVFVGNGASQYIEGFIERNGIVPELVEVVTDPTLAAHRAAGMERGFWRTFGPRAVINGLRAIVAGNRQTRVEGDSHQQGGVVVVDGAGEVVFAHADEVLGDHASLDDILAAALRITARADAVA